MRIFALLLLAVSVPSFAGVCERDNDDDAVHTVEYRPGPKLQPGEIVKIPGWDQTFIMMALPFTEFGHGKNESGEPKMWALHFPVYADTANRRDSYYFYASPLNLFDGIATSHVDLDDCSDVAIQGGPQPRHEVRVNESRRFTPRRTEITTNDVNNRGWPSAGVVNSYTTSRSIRTSLEFIQNETRLSFSVGLSSNAEVDRERDSDTGRYIYRVTEGGSKLSELEEGCYSDGFQYSTSSFEYDELDENLKVPLGPVVIASQCTFDEDVIYDYRAYLDPERHREYPTSLFYRLKQIIKYIYIEPLN